jgi:hypothetical protein
VVLLRRYSRTITEIVRIVNVYSVTDGHEEYKHNGRDSKPEDWITVHWCRIKDRNSKNSQCSGTEGQEEYE